MTRFLVVVVRDASQPMGVNNYRAELRHWGRVKATTEWVKSAAKADRDAEMYFPDFPKDKNG